MKLYYAPGTCALAAHIVLEEVGAPFTLEKVDFAADEQNSPGYLSLNPKGRVPLLVDGDFSLTEAPAILQYIAEQYPEADLLPPLGARERARMLEWLNYLSSGLHIAFSYIMRPHRYTDDASAHAGIVEKGRAVFHDSFQYIEGRVPEDGWLAGAYSVADPYLGTMYRWGNRAGYAMKQDFPRLAAHAERLSARPAVQRALATEGITLEDRPG